MLNLLNYLKSNLSRLLVLTWLSLLGFASPTWSKDGDVRLDVARQLAEKGDYDRAVQELRQYLSEHPEATDIYARIGNLRARQGNFRLAGENYKIALAKNPNLLEAREGLALAYEKAGDRIKAAEEWQKLRDTKDPEVRKRAVSHLNAIMNGKELPSSGIGSLHSRDGSSVHSSSEHSSPEHNSSGKVSKGKAKVGHGGFTEVAFSPALDSIPTYPDQGIYAQKEFQEALRLYREHKKDSALKWLRKSLLKAPRHPGAFYLGGVIRYEMGDYAKAIYNLKRGLEYPSRGFNAHYYLGRIYQKQDRQADAIAAYQKYLGLTKSPQGRKWVEGFLEQMAAPNTNPETNQEPGHNPGHKPTHEPAHEEGQIAGGGPGNAVKNGEIAQEMPPKPVLLGQDGPLFFLIPDRESASGQKLREAYEVGRKEKYEKAENILKETILAYGGSDNAEAAGLNLASVYLQLGLWDDAASRIKDYLGSNPNDTVKYPDAAYYLLALAELGSKKGEKAEKSLLKVKPGALFGPTQEEIDYRLSQAGELLQDSKKWAAYLEKAYASTKQSLRKAALSQKLGFLHSKFGSSDRAMDYYRKSIQDGLDTTSTDRAALSAIAAESHLRLADLTFKKKDWKGALAHYKAFIAKYPEHKESPWVHYQLANIYKVTNNFESALNEYKRVIDNYPDSYWASQAKWKREDTIWQKEYEEVLD
jgi:tetratricopeptide (TPR) repeat protein